jgi:hypothetical protein
MVLGFSAVLVALQCEIRIIAVVMPRGQMGWCRESSLVAQIVSSQLAKPNDTYLPCDAPPFLKLQIHSTMYAGAYRTSSSREKGDLSTGFGPQFKHERG